MNMSATMTDRLGRLVTMDADPGRVQMRGGLIQRRGQVTGGLIQGRV